jgi:hypothetical protein
MGKELGTFLYIVVLGSPLLGSLAHCHVFGVMLEDEGRQWYLGGQIHHVVCFLSLAGIFDT